MRNRAWTAPLAALATLAAGWNARAADFPLWWVFVALTPVALLGVVAVFAQSAGASLWPTLSPRTWGVVLGWPLTVPKAGDLVYLAWPGRRPLVKRLVGMPGDTVRSLGGELQVNGAPSRSLLPIDLSLVRAEREHEIHLGPNEVFVMGDNWSSCDSRHFGPVPRDAVVGRYVPLVQWGAAPQPEPLDPADRADVVFLQAVGNGYAELAEALATAGGSTRAQFSILLRWALVDAGATDRVEALLARRLADDEANAVIWRGLLSAHLASQGRFADVLTVATDDVGAQTEWHRWVTTSRALALARLGRWAEALASARSIDPEEDGNQFVAARVAALVGLGRLAEASRHLDALSAHGAWPAGGWEPYYRAVVAAAQGQFEASATLLNTAIDTDFTDLNAVRTHPLLARLRASDAWARVAARLDLHTPNPAG